MTPPKEKATELMKEFQFRIWQNGGQSGTIEKIAKISAITCVEQIQKIADPIFAFLNMEGEHNTYWQEVKNELELLK